MPYPVSSFVTWFTITLLHSIFCTNLACASWTPFLLTVLPSMQACWFWKVDPRTSKSWVSVHWFNCVATVLWLWLTCLLLWPFLVIVILATELSWHWLCEIILQCIFFQHLLVFIFFCWPIIPHWLFQFGTVQNEIFLSAKETPILLPKRKTAFAPAPSHWPVFVLSVVLHVLWLPPFQRNDEAFPDVHANNQSQSEHILICGNMCGHSVQGDWKVNCGMLNHVVALHISVVMKKCQTFHWQLSMKLQPLWKLCALDKQTIGGWVQPSTENLVLGHGFPAKLMHKPTKWTKYLNEKQEGTN